jgi:L-fuculose-phosphate aldolase
MTDETALREELTETYRELDRLGLIFLAAGNISARHGDGMLISPAGASARSIRPGSFVAAAFDGNCASGQRPSSEWSMHAAIYAAFPDAAAIVHTHSDHCVAMAATSQPLPPFHYMVAAFGGHDVPCTPYATYATPELGRLATSALADRTACLLGNHGMICHGKSLQKALSGALRLEVLCRQYILARQAGEIQLLSAKEMEVARARYSSYG